MLIPIGDEPNPRGTPWITWTLISINFAVFGLITLPLSLTPVDPVNPLLREYVQVVTEHLDRPVPLADLLRSLSAYDLFVFTWGYRSSDPQLLTLLTCMFLHGGFAHLFGNMLFLWIYGDNVEHRLGPLAFLFWYLATGVIATLAHAAFAGASPIPLVGASGAISGVLGFYFLWFPHNRVRVWLFIFPLFMQVIKAPARLVLGIYLIVDNLLPFFVVTGAGGGVAYGAHIGGFVAGLLVAWVVDRRDVAGRPEEYRPRPRAAAAAPAGGTIAQLLAAGRHDEAAAAYFALPTERTRRLLTPHDMLALGDWLATNGHPRAALIAYQRQLRDYPSAPGAAEAHARAGWVQLRAFKQATAAYQHFLDALDLDPAPATAESVRQGLAEIAALQKYQVERFGRRH